MKKFSFLLLIFLFTRTPFLQANIDTNGDWQFWNYDRYYAYFNKDAGVFIEQEYRVGDQISTLYYVHTLVGFFYDVFSWFRVMPAFRQTFHRGGEHLPWHTDYTPFFETLFTIPLGKSTFMNRTRFEYIIGSNIKTFLLRNQFFLTLPVTFTSLKIQPYLSDEIFITSYNGFNQNRFNAGFIFPFFPQFRTQVYYMLRNIKPEHTWHYNNAVGMNLIFDF